MKITEDLRERLQESVISELRENRFDIPPLPSAVIEINKLANSANPELKRVIELVERDVQLAARVLKLASSAFYGTVPITDLRHAMVRIGLNGLRDVAFAAGMGEVFTCRHLEPLMREENQRAYVLACVTSRACRMLTLDPNEGFLCGLMANVGRLALLEIMSRFIRQGRTEWTQPEFCQVALDDLHGEVGERVIKHWELAPILGDVARFHHFPHLAGQLERHEQALVLVVAAADLLVDGFSEEEEQEAQARHKEELLSRAGIQNRQVEELNSVAELASAAASNLFD